jgi:hypothetical protein
MSAFQYEDYSELVAEKIFCAPRTSAIHPVPSPQFKDFGFEKAKDGKTASVTNSLGIRH